MGGQGETLFSRMQQAVQQAKGTGPETPGGFAPAKGGMVRSRSQLGSSTVDGAPPPEALNSPPGVLASRAGEGVGRTPGGAGGRKVGSNRVARGTGGMGGGQEVKMDRTPSPGPFVTAGGKRLVTTEIVRAVQHNDR